MMPGLANKEFLNSILSMAEWGTIINHCVATDVTTLWHVVTAQMAASSVTMQQ